MTVKILTGDVRKILPTLAARSVQCVVTSPPYMGLRDDGTVWLNLGDSYANDGKWGGQTSGKHAKGVHDQAIGRTRKKTGLKPKDLMGIPWAVATALRAGFAACSGCHVERRTDLWPIHNGHI